MLRFLWLFWVGFVVFLCLMGLSRCPQTSMTNAFCSFLVLSTFAQWVDDSVEHSDIVLSLLWRLWLM